MQLPPPLSLLFANDVAKRRNGAVWGFKFDSRVEKGRGVSSDARLIPDPLLASATQRSTSVFVLVFVGMARGCLVLCTFVRLCNSGLECGNAPPWTISSWNLEGDKGVQECGISLYLKRVIPSLSAFRFWLLIDLTFLSLRSSVF